jgi:hypothetical protein
VDADNAVIDLDGLDEPAELGALSPERVASGTSRTFLAWTERVTISPMNSFEPVFLKLSMVAVEILLDLYFEPAPLRPR